MKLFSKNAGNKTVNINGKNVKFTNCVAEVEDSFGAEALKLGLPDLFEDGKQPVFETPKEVRMKTDFQDKEEWYQKEIAKLKTSCDAYKRKVEELQIEVKNWKCEYEKEKELRIASVKGNVTIEAPNEKEEMKASNEKEEVDEKTLRQELSAMKKDELLQFAAEAEIDVSKLENLTKSEIIDIIIGSEN